MRRARPVIFTYQNSQITIFNDQFGTGQQSCQKDCAEALFSNGWFSLLEQCLIEPSEALERYRCLLYCVRSSKSNSTGSVLQKVFATGCQICQKTGQQSMVIFYRSGFTESEDGPNTKNVPNRCA